MSKEDSKHSSVVNEKHPDHQHLEDQASIAAASVDVNVKLANPLRQYSREELIDRARRFAVICEREDLKEEFAKGALVAAHPACKYKCSLGSF